MSDDLEDLRRAFDAGLAKPDARARADAIALAMKNFDRLQETEEQARQTSERPEERGVFKGARKMISNLSSRGILTATTALAAVGLVALIPVLRDSQPPQVVPLPVSGPATLYSGGAQPVPEGLPEVGPLLSRDAPQVLMESAPSPVPQGPAQKSIPAPASPGGGIYSNMESRGLSARTVPRPQPLLFPDPVMVAPQTDTEAFPEADDNPLKVTAQDPVSTFSIDVDTASWALIRDSLSRGQLPPQGAVRIEEMVNYFSYDYPAPDPDAPFATHVGVAGTPWREGTQIVHIGLQGMMPVERPPMNLVFLIDTSGSMSQPDKLPLLQQSFRLMLGQLSAQDSIAIVTYAGSAGLALAPTPASDRATILTALEGLQAGGSTAGQAGLQQAYATAAEMTQDGEVSRVILATDGDFNVGISDPDALKDYIETERESGIYLSVLGFGRGNLDDATMQALAQTGNGIASYIDTLAEAQKVLVDQLTGALVPIADDVKIQVEWNPALVAEYRLIGYETRTLKREDFNNDRVDAGEIGAGTQVTAIYEITPEGSPARMTDPLRYSDAPSVVDESGELGFLRLRYKDPGADDSKLIETPIRADAEPLAEADWALAIAGFGQILRGSDLIGDWSMGDAIALAQGARGNDPFGYRQEAITLMRLADSLMQ